MRNLLLFFVLCGSLWAQSATVNGGATFSGGVTINPIPSAPPPPNTFYVDVAVGSDSNPGTQAQPFKSINQGRLAVGGRAGYKVEIVASGIYYQTQPLVFGTLDSGTIADPIIYEGYLGQTPVISAGTPLTPASGFTWSDVGATCGASCEEYNLNLNQSFGNFESAWYIPVGGTDSTRRFRPRSTPGGSGGTYQHTIASCFPTDVSGVGNCQHPVGNGYCSTANFVCYDRFKYNSGEIGNNMHGVGLNDIEIDDFEKWTMSIMKMQSAAGGVAIMTGPTTAASNGTYGWLCSVAGSPNNCTTGHRYLLVNCKPGDAGCISATQAVGLFYLDRCPTQVGKCTTVENTWVLHYYANTALNENPNLDTFIAGKINPPAIILNGAQNINFNNVAFEHDNWIVPQKGDPETQGSSNIPALVSVQSGTSNINFNACKVAHTSGVGIEFEGTHTIGSFSNGAVYDTGALGIRVGKQAVNSDTTAASVPSFDSFLNNIITGTGRFGASGIGQAIWVGNAHHITITHNEMSYTYGGAVRIGFRLNRGAGPPSWSDHNVVTYNLIYLISQGVTSDMAGVYMASGLSTNCPPFPTPCNTITNNTIHDVVHPWEDADGYGGNGIYFDQGTSQVLATNNLIYRVSQNGYFDHISDATNDNFAENNVVTNNIFAYNGTFQATNKTWLQRSGESPSMFSATHNLVYINGLNTDHCGGLSTSFQSCPGKWSPYDCNGNIVSPTTKWLTDYNMYFDKSGTPFDFIITNKTPSTGMCDPVNQTGYTYIHYNQTSCGSSDVLSCWTNGGGPNSLMATGEDAHSVNQNPGFKAPQCPDSTVEACMADVNADDYTLPGGSPGVGFVPWDLTQPGRTNAVIFPPRVADGYPVFPLNPSTDF